MTDNTKLNVAAFAEAIYKKQCAYTGPDHEAYCVGELKTALQSMESKISVLLKRDRVVGGIAEWRRKEVVKLQEQRKILKSENKKLKIKAKYRETKLLEVIEELTNCVNERHRRAAFDAWETSRSPK